MSDDQRAPATSHDMRRALWITRFDWDGEAELRSLTARAIDAGFTDLLMQVRGAGDALYRSSIVPSSPKIAGRLGGEAMWDPLAVVIDEMQRAEGVRVHAWLNVLSGWPATSSEACQGTEPSPAGWPDHLLIRHPGLVLVDETGRPMPCPNEWDYLWLSPRHRVLGEDLRAVVAELCASYPIDGIHLDRIRYPGAEWRDPGFGDRCPEAVTQLMRVVRDATPMDIEVTVSLVPDYLAVDELGRPRHLSEYGQDGWSWVADGLVGSVMPMVYTPVAFGREDDWRRLMHGHIDVVGAENVWAPVFAGLPVDQIERQVSAAVELGIAGQAWYSAGLILRGGHWERLGRWL